MEQILYGQPVANLLDEVTKKNIQTYINKNGNSPTLTAITVGRGASQEARSTKKRANTK